MPIQTQGAGGSTLEVGAFAAKGAHILAKPQDYGAFGHYAAVLSTGAIAAAAQTLGELVQMRWVDTARVCLIHEIQVLKFAATTAFAAGPFLFDVCRATAWSADGTGGTAVAVTTPQNKLRTSMGASLFSTGFRLASSTSVLGAGTKTFDNNPFGATYGEVDAIANKNFIPQSNVVTTASPAAGPGIVLWKADIASGEHPIVLSGGNGSSTCEGIAVRATVPGTGVWNASILVKWSELAAF